MTARRAIGTRVFYLYNFNMKREPKTKQFHKEGKYIIRLKDIIISNTKKEISDFYAPDLKFLLFPIAWDESGSSIQCHVQKNLEALYDLGNMVLGSNNTRELSDKNQVIFSSNNVQGQIGILLMGIVFDSKTTLNKQLIKQLKKQVRKSKFNKLVQSKASFSLIQKSAESLFNQLTGQEKSIKKTYLLANYKGNEIIESCNLPQNSFSIVSDNAHARIRSEIINTKSAMREPKDSFYVIPDMNAPVKRLSVRGGLSSPPKALGGPVKLLSSSYGKIRSLLVTVPIPYLEKQRIPYTLYINIIKELAEKFPKRKLTLLIETSDEQISKHEATQIDTLKNEIKGAELLVLTTTKADDSFSLWAQDAFLTAQARNSEEAGIIIAPEYHQRTNRCNDGSIAKEVVALHPAGYTSFNFPTAVEGGNILVADDFILVGKNEVLNSGYDKTKFIELFTDLFGKEKPVILISAPRRKPKTVKSDLTTRKLTRKESELDKIIITKNGQQYKHSMYQWRGTEQPIFHIDVFMTLLGRDEEGKQLILVGEPVEGFDKSDLDDKTLEIANVQLEDAKKRISECIRKLEKDLKKYNVEYKILRNPLPLTYYTYGLETSWYWASYNNCLVEITGAGQKTAWLPSYHNPSFHKNSHWEYLKKCDLKNTKIFRENGFTTYLFNNDFHFLASRNGSLHCMTKCLNRSNAI